MATAEVPEEKVPSVEAAMPPKGELINASGHRQEVERNFGLISICAIAITTGNTWIAQGGSVVCLVIFGED